MKMPNTTDTISLHGHGVIEVRDAVTGALIDRQTYTNVITDLARAQIMQGFKGATVDIEVTHIAIGTDGTAAVASDTALGAEVLRSTPTSVIDYSATEIGWRLFVSASTGNGNTFREIGLFNDPSTGTMFARSVSFTPIAKNSAITITFTHILRYV
jgi:hypothetical protein